MELIDDEVIVLHAYFNMRVDAMLTSDELRIRDRIRDEAKAIVAGREAGTRKYCCTELPSDEHHPVCAFHVKKEK